MKYGINYKLVNKTNQCYDETQTIWSIFALSVDFILNPISPVSTSREISDKTVFLIQFDTQNVT